MKYKDFTCFPVWQKSCDLLIKTYKITREFPAEEKFGLTSDMRRASNSNIHNITEGFGRFGKKDKTRFYKISRGSCNELQSQTFVSNRLEYIKEALVLRFSKTFQQSKQNLTLSLNQSKLMKKNN